MSYRGAGRPFRAASRVPDVGRSFRARWAHVGILIACWLALDATVLACPICFQAQDGPVTDGVRAAVLVLVGVTTAVLSGFAAFVVGFARRTR
jgi:hypothetical protein